MRKVMLTVDVEAFPHRADGSPVEKLIWGGFPEGDFGIRRMMSVADVHGAKMVMYVDYAEAKMHGESFLDVAREIDRRGHDLQLHLHLDSFKTSDNLNDITAEKADTYLTELLAMHRKVSSKPMVNFRGGGYRYGRGLMAGLVKHGFTMCSNYNLAAKLQPYDIGDLKQFKWDNGLIEMPVATAANYRDRNYRAHFNFNIDTLTNGAIEETVANSLEFLNGHYAQRGDDALAVFVLHSWSFLKMDESGKFSAVDPDAPERFGAMLAAWKKAGVQFITSADVTKGVLGQLETKAEPKHSLTVPEPPALKSGEIICSVCGTPADQFTDYNGPKRLCPKCRSTERQRLFAVAYDTYIKDKIDLSKANLLVISPIAVERTLFAQRGIVDFKSLDVRPGFHADYETDLCNMPSVPSGEFDAVYASFVLGCVYDLDKALSEIRRVLKPGGSFITCDSVYGDKTVENTTADKITAWYGQELFDKYKIGNFRTFGEVDYLAKLQEYFVVKTYPGVDVGTKSKSWLTTVCTKRG